MIELPQRHSLVNETASVLRGGIRNGTWKTILPGERSLAIKLQVSRPTVRAAIALLEREGLLAVERGIGRRILAMPLEEAPPPRRDCVGVLSPIPLHLMPPVTLFYMNELRDHLQHAGFRLEIFAEPGLEQRRPHRLLEKVTRQPGVACWILSAPLPAVQEWFARRGLPALVAGSVQEDITLPSIDLDYRAICRHAAGVLLRLGHRRMALFMAGSSIPANTLSLAGFQEGIKAEARFSAEGLLVEHDGSPAGIFQKLDALLARPNPPTALLVSRPLHVLATISHLGRRGIQAPRDISLISRDSDVLLDYHTPAVSRYIFKRRLFAERLSRLAVQLAGDGSIPPQPHWQMPDFEPGETIGKCPRHLPA